MKRPNSLFTNREAESGLSAGSRYKADLRIMKLKSLGRLCDLWWTNIFWWLLQYRYRVIRTSRRPSKRSTMSALKRSSQKIFYLIYLFQQGDDIGDVFSPGIGSSVIAAFWYACAPDRMPVGYVARRERWLSLNCRIVQVRGRRYLPALVIALELNVSSRMAAAAFARHARARTENGGQQCELPIRHQSWN